MSKYDSLDHRDPVMEAARNGIELALQDLPARVGEVQERWGILQASGTWSAAERHFVVRAWRDDAGASRYLHLESACWIDDETALQRRVVFRNGAVHYPGEPTAAYEWTRVAAAQLRDAIRDAEVELAGAEPIPLEPRPAVAFDRSNRGYDRNR